MEDWRDPRTKAKAAIRSRLLQGLVRLGRLEQAPAADRSHVQEAGVQYFGDIPNDGAGLRPREQHRRVLANPPPSIERAGPVDYSPTGMAWAGGRLIERWSVRTPSFGDVLAGPKASRRVNEGVIVESTVNVTYGDWVHTILGTLMRAAPLPAPLFLPPRLTEKSYVARDLKMAGIRYETADSWTRIENALVLRKQTPLTYWTRDDVVAYQRLFAPERETPAPGSIAYFGRFDLESEVKARRFPSEATGEAVKRLGGSVHEQQGLTPETAPRYARQVETVIADHGSGVLNIMHWRVKNLIELVVDNWWTNNTLFVAPEAGVENIAVIDVDGLSADEIEAKLRTCLDVFQGRTIEAAD